MLNTLAGNEQVKVTLRRLMSSGRVPNALLFAGDEGIGKRQFAIELAKAFVCIEPGQLEACGVCPACMRAGEIELPRSDKKDDYERVVFSKHLDIGVVIPFKRNVRVDAIRDLEREANFRPYEGRARVFIIDDADKMADPAANALLKTLEEPPPTSHIFLVTSRPDSLLPTIRSRCQMLRFVPVETASIVEYLQREKAFTPDEAGLAARLARGSIGRAIAIDVAQFRKRRDKMLSVVRGAVENGDIVTMLRTGEEMNDAKNKDTFEENIDILETLLYDIWTTAVNGNSTQIVNADLSDELGRLAGRAERSALPKWLAAIEAMRQSLAVNINRKIATDSLFVSMAGA